MITICVVCKKELGMASGATIGKPFASIAMNEEVIVSHSICYECGVKLYGVEMMATVGAKIGTAAAKETVSKAR
jgi:hypothetical protein